MYKCENPDCENDVQVYGNKWCPECHHNMNENTEPTNTEEASPSSNGFVMCACLTMAGYGPDSYGKHHHKKCPKYKTEKFPYLAYYEEAVNAWIPAPELVSELISVEDQLELGDTMTLEFKRYDLTDYEFDNMPEAE